MLVESDFWNWPREYDKSMRHILSLNDGWNGAISKVPSPHSIQLSGMILLELQKSQLRLPDDAYPVFYGGIEMAWVLKNGKLIVNIDDNPIQQIMVKFDSNLSQDHSTTAYRFEHIESVISGIKFKIIKNNQNDI